MVPLVKIFKGLAPSKLTILHFYEILIFIYSLISITVLARPTDFIRYPNYSIKRISKLNVKL